MSGRRPAPATAPAAGGRAWLAVRQVYRLLEHVQRRDPARCQAEQDLFLADLHQYQPVARTQRLAGEGTEQAVAARSGLLHPAHQPGEQEDQVDHQAQAEHHLGQLRGGAGSGAHRRRGGARRPHRGALSEASAGRKPTSR